MAEVQPENREEEEGFMTCGPPPGGVQGVLASTLEHSPVVHLSFTVCGLYGYCTFTARRGREKLHTADLKFSYVPYY